MIITIDGPMASGKSTVARVLAERMGIAHLNSGLLFRALAYLLLNKSGYDLNSIANPTEADVAQYLDPARLTYRFEPAQSQVFFDGENITSFLKNANIDQASSLMSANGTVRSHLLTLLRALGNSTDCIIDGRDAGSIIFPNADLKFYLTASQEVRAKRWIADQARLNHPCTLPQALEHITTRDTRDMNRPIAPLIVPEGAMIIDNSNLNLEETVQLFLDTIKTKKGAV